MFMNCTIPKTGWVSHRSGVSNVCFKVEMSAPKVREIKAAKKDDDNDKEEEETEHGEESK